MKIIANHKIDVARCPIDFFSIGHVLMGQIGFYISKLFILYILRFNPVMINLWSALGAIGFGIIWEPFENTTLWKLGLKFEGRKDTLINSVFDIFFVILGTIVVLSIPHLWLNLMLIGIEFILFFALRHQILHRNYAWLKKAERLKIQNDRIF